MKKVCLLMVLLFMIASIPALADQGDKIIRFGLVHVSPTGDLTFEESEPPYIFREVVEADAGTGGFFGFEFMVTDKVGIDGTLLFANHDVDASIVEIMDGDVVFDESATIGDITMMPLLVSAHFHVVQKDAIDVYVGPTIGYVMYGDLEFIPDAEEFNLPIKDDFGVGFVVGLDTPVGGGGWNFSTALRYLKTGAQIDESGIEGPDTVDVDPWMIQVGAGKRW